MNYEKAYKEALERARELSIDGYLDAIAIDELFPELKEFEDERVSKGLVIAVSATPKGNKLFGADVTREEVLAWLEKQKQKGEFDIIDFNCLNTCKKTIEAYRKIEEDKYGVAFPSYDQALIWLDSLKIRIQPKPTWSKADKRMIGLIISVFEVNHPKSIFKDGLRAVYTDEIVSWLKSIEDRVVPQHHWKPSEGQIEALEKTLIYFRRLNAFGETIDNLKELHQQLNKL